MADPRIGLGFDAHAWGAGGTLHLAGVRFPDRAKLSGHSDGDVVCHALADALLGGAGMGDIGEHFPDSDARFAGIGGLDLLARTVELVRGAGLRPISADVTVVADQPHVAPFRDQMRANLAVALGVGQERVSVKATRPEGVGLSGDGAGCLALAVLTEG